MGLVKGWDIFKQIDGNNFYKDQSAEKRIGISVDSCGKGSGLLLHTVFLVTMWTWFLELKSNKMLQNWRNWTPCFNLCRYCWYSVSRPIVRLEQPSIRVGETDYPSQETDYCTRAVNYPTNAGDTTESDRVCMRAFALTRTNRKSLYLSPDRLSLPSTCISSRRQNWRWRLGTCSECR